MAKVKGLFTCLCLALIALVLSGCASTSREDYQLAEAENLAGWIVISGGRLYLDEARVYVQEFASSEFWQDGLFARHAGENVIVFAYGDNERLYVHGFFSDGFYEGYVRDDGADGVRWVGRREYGIFPSSRQVAHLGRNIVSFEITSETTFSFVDTAALFVDADSIDRIFVTTINDNFWTLRGGRWNRLHCRYDSGNTMAPEEFLLRASCMCAERICLRQAFNPASGSWECAHGGDACLIGNRREPVVFVRVENGRVVSVTEEFLFTQ